MCLCAFCVCVYVRARCCYAWQTVRKLVGVDTWRNDDDTKLDELDENSNGSLLLEESGLGVGEGGGGQGAMVDGGAIANMNEGFGGEEACRLLRDKLGFDEVGGGMGGRGRRSSLSSLFLIFYTLGLSSSRLSCSVTFNVEVTTTMVRYWFLSGSNNLAMTRILLS